MLLEWALSFERVKLDGCISHCAGGGGGGEPLNAQREECSSERQQDAACPWNICGPVPRLTRWGWDLFVSRSLSRLAHRRETSPKSYRWEKVEGKFLKKGRVEKLFLWCGLWDFSIIGVEKPILLQFGLHYFFFTPDKQSWADTCCNELPQQKTGSCCRCINTKKGISLSSGEDDQN